MSDSSNSFSGLISLSEIRPYIKLLLKNWWLIAILAGTGYASARLITHRQLDMYSASTEILIAKDKDLDYQERLGGMVGAQNSRFGGTDTKNQERILRSYDLVGRAVDNMPLDIDYFLVGRLKTSHVSNFGAMTISASPELFNSSYLGLDIDLFVEDEAHFRMSYVEPNGEVKETIHPFGVPLEGPNLALTITLKDKSVFDLSDPSGPRIKIDALEQARKQHYRFRVFNRGQRIDQMRGGLQVDNVMGTNILTLQASSTLPGRPKTFLNILGKEFIEYTKEARLQSSLKTESFINVQLNELITIMDSLELMVDGFKQQNEILDLTREQSEYFTTLVTLETKERELQFRLEALTSLQSYLAAGIQSNSLPPTSYLIDEDPLLIEQVGTLFQMRSDRTRALLDVTEDSYQIRRLDSAISNSRFTVKRYIEDTRVAISNQIQNVQSEISALENRLSGIPATQRDILSMERKLSVNEKMYVYLLEARAQNIIKRAGIAPEASIIEIARSAGIIGPNKQLTIRNYTIYGALIALAIAFARMLLFERIESTQELREASVIPVVVGLPNYPGIDENPLAILADSRAQITEAFRSLRTNLQYLLAKEGANTILISSLHPGEGKSFVSSNLATVLAKTGKKVVLVDFDMHKPKIHKNFKLSNQLGLSTYLIGRCSADEMGQAGPVDTLTVITAGPVPPNASELVLNDRMDPLLEKLRAEYDFVILDTPPMLLITDALVLMSKVDTGLLVTNTEKATKRGIKHLEELLGQNDLSHASLVMNNIRATRFGQYYAKYAYKYGFGYGYGYGYGYGGYGTGTYGDEPETKA
ncbi:MAG: polysaccharide biosynthesis tyrosine autokinase [Flavobacteriales bacterium]|nr:polysaccharide biosynthesis tyrosine autokinase [Flavobacteriales bacterium]